ncbi:MAG: hypothetical protein J6K95_05170 [Rikenellaceae bacterium]|nr:hypothetical protein [Rikenellaceae bacterium]
MQNEDPAAVLDSLRERYAPDASEEHDRAYFLADFIELLQVADGVAGFVSGSE